MDFKAFAFSLLTSKKPAVLSIGLLGLMALGALPWNLPAALLLGGIGLVTPLAGRLFDRPNRTVRKVKFPPPSCKLMLVLLSLATQTFLTLGCLSDHPFLRSDSLAAIYQTAQPYLIQDCRELAVFPGYQVDFGGMDDSGAIHGFGGIVGGCGRYAKMACWMPPSQPADETHPQSVTCAAVEELATVNDLKPNGNGTKIHNTKQAK